MPFRRHGGSRRQVGSVVDRCVAAAATRHAADASSPAARSAGGAAGGLNSILGLVCMSRARSRRDRYSLAATAAARSASSWSMRVWVPSVSCVVRLNTFVPDPVISCSHVSVATTSSGRSNMALVAFYVSASQLAPDHGVHRPWPSPARSSAAAGSRSAASPASSVACAQRPSPRTAPNRPSRPPSPTSNRPCSTPSPREPSGTKANDRTQGGCDGVDPIQTQAAGGGEQAGTERPGLGGADEQHGAGTGGQQHRSGQPAPQSAAAHQQPRQGQDGAQGGQTGEGRPEEVGGGVPVSEQVGAARPDAGRGERPQCGGCQPCCSGGAGEACSGTPSPRSAITSTSAPQRIEEEPLERRNQRGRRRLDRREVLDLPLTGAGTPMPSRSRIGCRSCAGRSRYSDCTGRPSGTTMSI